MKKSKDPIPDTDDREELAKFWDTHSIADYLDELQPVKAKVSQNFTSEIRVSLDPDTIKGLGEIGAKKHMNPVILARTWITDLVNKELKHTA
jgi:hypothetical protein